MQPLANILKEHKVSSKAPHYLAHEAERLCDQLGIPFHTFMLRAVKVNKRAAEETAAYMKDRGISSIRYFVKVWYNKTR